MKTDPSDPLLLPWTRGCFVCGEENFHGLHAKLRIEGGDVVMDYETRESDRGYRDIMHGGLAVTLLDEAMTWAAIVSARRACVAAELGARLLKPVRVPGKVTIRARVKRAGRRLLEAESELCGENGAVLVRARGKYTPAGAGFDLLSGKDFVRHPNAILIEKIVDFDSPGDTLVVAKERVQKKR